LSLYLIEGFTATNSTNTSSLTSSLTNNLNFDYINTMDFNEQYIYRVQQAQVTLINATAVPQLTFTIWSGMYLKIKFDRNILI
jgi:hypothetical protein